MLDPGLATLSLPAAAAALTPLCSVWSLLKPQTPQRASPPGDQRVAGFVAPLPFLLGLLGFHTPAPSRSQLWRKCRITP